MNFRKLFEIISMLMSNKELWDAIQTILDFISNLNAEEQEAYFAYLDAKGGVGVPTSSGPAPKCPPEAQVVEDRIVTALQS